MTRRTVRKNEFSYLRKQKIRKTSSYPYLKTINKLKRAFRNKKQEKILNK